MAESMLDEAHDWMKQLFAPWVQSLGLKPVKVQGGEAELLKERAHLGRVR